MQYSSSSKVSLHLLIILDVSVENAHVFNGINMYNGKRLDLGQELPAVNIVCCWWKLRLTYHSFVSDMDPFSKTAHLLSLVGWLVLSFLNLPTVVHHFHGARKNPCSVCVELLGHIWILKGQLINILAMFLLALRNWSEHTDLWQVCLTFLVHIRIQTVGIPAKVFTLRPTSRNTFSYLLRCFMIQINHLLIRLKALLTCSGWIQWACLEWKHKMIEEGFLSKVGRERLKLGHKESDSTGTMDELGGNPWPTAEDKNENGQRRLKLYSNLTAVSKKVGTMVTLWEKWRNRSK